MNSLTRRTFNETIARISQLYCAGMEGSEEYDHLMDIAWATAPDDVCLAWTERAIAEGYLHLNGMRNPDACLPARRNKPPFSAETSTHNVKTGVSAENICCMIGVAPRS